MSASPTTVPAVKAKLLELFKAAVPSETEVWPARTEEEHQVDENVYLGSVRGQREFKVVSAVPLPNSRQENYEVLVEVDVYRAGVDIEATEARLWVIAQALELAVAEHRTLDGLSNTTWAISSHFEQHTKTAQDGVLANYTFGVAVTARI